MNFLRYTYVLLFCSLYLSCQLNDTSAQEQDAQDLDVKLSEIKTLAESVFCEDAETWSFTEYGLSACGGPSGYIGYSNTIDIDSFLKLIEEYTIAEDTFNREWEISDICSTVPEPIGVICENGVPVLEYEGVLTQEQELQNLSDKLLEIETLAESVSCEDSETWSFTAYGSRACGGPSGYLAYSNTIDTDNFLKLVKEYTIAEDAFNKKWSISSICSMVPEPIGVICKNGVAALLYEGDLTQEQELQILADKLEEIKTLAESVSCVDAETWLFTAYGSGGCGGPSGYIAYSNAIDTDYFLKLIEDYTIAEDAFNRKWEILGLCVMMPEPTGVICKNGVAALLYEGDLTQEEESNILLDDLSEIETLAESVSCVDAETWLFTAYGSRACGGPSGYIAYSTNTDVDYFLKLVKEYTIAEDAFNRKWSISSICSMVPVRIGVICVTGNAVLQYQ